MLWDIRLTADTVAGADADAVEFDFDPNQPQILALVYSTEEVSANELLFQIARHNFNSFVVKDFDLEQMNFGQLGLLLVKGFANEAEVRHYQSVLEASTVFTLPQEVTPVIITEKNFQTLISKGRTFEEYFQAASAASLEQTESAVLDEPDVE
jgi:hypothetical protein